jgi:hypothetical protein
MEGYVEVATSGDVAFLGIDAGIVRRTMGLP